MTALMEGVANGTTTFGDYDAPMNAIVQSHLRMGNRAVVCQGRPKSTGPTVKSGSRRAGNPVSRRRSIGHYGEAGLAAELSLYDRWNGNDNDRIRVIFGPVAADMVSEELLLRFQDGGARTRLAHSSACRAGSRAKTTPPLERSGLRAIPYLDSIGLLAPTRSRSTCV